ncbi:MAG: VOC family protein [Bacteroidetes bacterium]|nr:VOC family protein [Bacteroidota bacterium]MBP6428003.1 VOC family protein [Bacteroidia bacterium]MBP6657915.1 VOC family protein [Bacteroidia bacterium]
MKKQIFVNLPVKDLKKSVEFFTSLGYSFNPQFTDENATCMIISDEIYVMLLVEKFFQTFTTKEIADAKKQVEAIICLSMDSREEVDEIVKKGVSGGAKVTKTNDHGWMYQSGFEDLDGHLWEFAYMDTAALEKMTAADGKLA